MTSTVLSNRNGSLVMNWHDLCFLHWPVSVAQLRPHVPPGLEIDTCENQAWVGLVPFTMTGIRHRLLPALPGLSAFAELNVRTYVRHRGRLGVWFLSLDAAHRIAVRVARLVYRLPYYDAKISVAPCRGAIRFHSRRVHRRAPAAQFEADYAPVSAPFHAEAGTLDHWLIERYSLFAAGGNGTLHRCDVFHRPWCLQRAEADVTLNTLCAPLRIDLPRIPPVLHFARCTQVVATTLIPLSHS